MQRNGIINGYLNQGINKMKSQGMVKHGEGKERRSVCSLVYVNVVHVRLLTQALDLRLADINGDGRDDFVYVDPLNGSVTAWYNGGAIPSSGSAFQWNWQNVVSSGGSSRGECVEFGKLYGEGRADYIGNTSHLQRSYQYHQLTHAWSSATQLSILVRTKPGLGC